MPYPKGGRLVNPTAVEAVRARDPYCQVCGKARTEVHHIHTRGAGGDDVPENLIGLCRECHNRVHAGNGLTPDDLRRILRDKYGFVYRDLE
jgi:5-methylcytosine-specific restriction endonuclease McrA